MSPAADIPAQSAMFAAGVEKLEGAFYSRLSLAHWGRSTRERNLYNQHVKGSAHCLPFGPGAGGNLDGWFLMNTSAYDKWLEAVNAGIKPAAMLVEPGPNFRLYRALAFELEHLRLDIPALERKFGLELYGALEPLLEQWRRAGLLNLGDRKITLTLAGQFWQVNISQLMQDFLKRHLEG